MTEMLHKNSFEIVTILPHQFKLRNAFNLEAGKCAKSQRPAILFALKRSLNIYFCQRLCSPFYGRSFTSLLSITFYEIQQSTSLNPITKLNEQSKEVSVI